MTNKRTPNNPEPVDYEMCVMSKNEQIEETEKRIKYFTSAINMSFSSREFGILKESLREHLCDHVGFDYQETECLLDRFYEKEVNDGQ